MMSEPQPPTTDSLPSPPPIISISSSAIIQSNDNPVRHQPYHLRNPQVTVIDLSTDEDHPKDVIIENNIHWKKRASKNRHHCRLCREKGHAMYNCWTFKCPYCNDKAPRHWAWNCPKKPSGLAPIHLTTPYDNKVIELPCISPE